MDVDEEDDDDMADFQLLDEEELNAMMDCTEIESNSDESDSDDEPEGPTGHKFGWKDVLDVITMVYVI